jgi:hypothetical protein
MEITVPGSIRDELAGATNRRKRDAESGGTTSERDRDAGD